MMKTTRTLLLAATLSAGLFAATGANATLVSALGGQVVNDTVLNITWLSNANLADTNTFGLATGVILGTDANGYESIIHSDGRMTWGGAMKWIAAMNTANYLGYNDWRLPTITDTGAPGCNFSYNGTDCGNNSTGSEMTHLYFNDFGNKAYYNTSGVAQSGYGLVNDPANPNDESLFTNLQFYYWSAEYAPDPNYAWIFSTYDGFQGADDKGDDLFAMAVRPGQVAAVPVPAAAWLLGSGLLGLIGVARRRLVIR